MEEIKINHTAKNSVFVDLFQNKSYLLKLYQTLHPEDTTATEDSLTDVTIKNVLTDSLYNDLGFIVNDDKLMILIEAQSTWSVNILVRILLYLAQSYHEYFQKTSQNLYKSKKVKIPKPELYIIYVGNKGKKPDVISLSEEFFESADIDVEIKAKVIYETDKDDIINQYIIFCKVFNEQTDKYGLTKEAVNETIYICKNRNILREYLAEREKEVITIMMSLFDEEEIMNMYVKDLVREAEEKAEKRGEKRAEKAAKKSARETAERMIKKGKMTIEDIADCVPILSLEEIKKIEVGINNYK